MEKHGMKFPSLSFTDQRWNPSLWLDGKVSFCVCVCSFIIVVASLLTVSTFHTTTQVHSGRSSFSDFEILKFHLWAFKDVAIGSASMLFGQFMLASNQDSQTFEGNNRIVIWFGYCEDPCVERTWCFSASCRSMQPRRSPENQYSCTLILTNNIKLRFALEHRYFLTLLVFLLVSQKIPACQDSRGILKRTHPFCM